MLALFVALPVLKALSGAFFTEAGAAPIAALFERIGNERIWGIDCLIGVWLARLFAFTPIAFMIMRGVVAGVAPSLDEASIMLRANTATTLRRLVLPPLKPALVAARVYSFVRSLTMVSAVTFLVTAENELATTYLIGRVGNGDYGVALAYCTVLMLLMSAATALLQFAVGELTVGRRAVAGQ